MTHDQIEAMTLATHIAVLKDGEVAAVRDAARNLQPAGQPVRRRFHGLAVDEPVWKGRVAKNGDAAAITFAAEGGAPVSRWRAPTGADISSLEDGDAVILGIRPEAVSDLQSVDRSARTVAHPRRAGRGRRAGRLRHFRRDQDCRSGDHRADARRHRSEARSGRALRFQYGQGRAVRSPERQPDRSELRFVS